MRPSTLTASFVTLAAAVSTFVTAPAAAAVDESAQDTIARLEADGYQVNVDRVGAGRIEDCVVTSVRNPQTQTRSIRDYYGKPDENGKRRYRIVQVVTGRTISVSLDCSR